MKIGIKYCGGCNPHYDRTQVVLKLCKEFEGLIAVSANETEAFDVICVICGCHSGCAEHTKLNGRFGKVVLTQESDYDKLSLFINKLESKNKE
ncbi:hypothetical protein V6615_04505 [Oscillospiraceae bacterium PP1C4]